MIELNQVVGCPEAFDAKIPNTCLADPVNHNIVGSMIEGGVYLEDLPVNRTLVLTTKNSSYTLVKRGEEDFLLSGHPKFCPEPVPVRINGSTWGGSMIKTGFLGRGMRMEFQHPDYEWPITTSRVVELFELQ